MRGRNRSSAYRVTPVTLPVPSTRAGTGCPMMEYVEATATSGRTGFNPSTSLRGQFNRFKNFNIARAAAEIPCQSFLDLLAVRHGVGPQQGHGRQEHPWCTIATLGSPEFAKGVLQLVQRTPSGHAFNGENLLILHFDG